MIFDNNKISDLRYDVSLRLSQKRYVHTLGVEEMAKFLGMILIPEKVNELCAAALLHDIAKEISYDEQISLLASSNVEYTHEDIDTRPALHSITAIPIIKKDFTEYASADVLSAVASHTLGKAGMSVFDEIIFISDYTEVGRSYPSCKAVRNYLLDNIKSGNSYDENLNALHMASLEAINLTIESLAHREEKIHSRTFTTKKYFEDILRNCSLFRGRI